MKTFDVSTIFGTRRIHEEDSTIKYIRICVAGGQVAMVEGELYGRQEGS